MKNRTSITKRRCRQALKVLAAALLLVAGQPKGGAQSIVNFNAPTNLCAGEARVLSFGYLDTNSIVIQSHHASLGQSVLTFLPDGKPCSGSCSYQSPVTFSDFAPGATITSVNDIKYVRLKLEHSYIGDIYIGITCPNGQSASLMNYSNSGSSSCSSSIPSSHKGWSNAYSNASNGSYFGTPVDDEAYDDCDPNAYGNRPGTGWNYCWSNNTNSGYTYAGQDGIIYRAINAHNGKIDSSNVAAGTKFYHPNQSFSSLIGCPLNGEWYIEVMDGYNIDNGWIFEWELALDPSLIPNDCDPEGYAIEGSNIDPINDSTFLLTAPADLATDTSILYTFQIISTCGDTIDTSAVVRFHPNYNGNFDTVVCDSLVWAGHTYTSTSNINFYGTTAYGCDSIGRIGLTVHPSYHFTYGDTIVENELPYPFHELSFNHSVYDTLLERTSVYGCDSSTVFTLRVYLNQITTTDTTLCDNLLPYLWLDSLYTAATVDTVLVPTSTGADSMMVLNLHVLPTSDTTVHHETVENALPVTYNGQTYTADASDLFHYTNRHGCDSTIHYRLTVHYNQDTDLYRTVCDNQLPLTWKGMTFEEAGTQSFTIHDRYGADSTVVLHLTVNPTYDTTIEAEACDNKPYVIAGHSLATEGIHTITLRTVDHCDSTLHVDLSVYPHWELDYYDTVCRSFGSDFEGDTYYAAGDYSYTYETSHGCDSTMTLHLTLLAEDLRAKIHAIPWMVTTDAPDIRLFDHSRANDSRLWIIGDETFTAPNIKYVYTSDDDSVMVQLVAYSIEGCTDTAVGYLRLDRAAIAVPNAFTPGQSTNGLWYIACKDIAEIETWIYNRLGLLVAHLEGTDATWDGTTDGKPCPQGEYVYRTRYRTNPRPDMPKEQTGTILLIR
jgi:gliding motility-associated-like protein